MSARAVVAAARIAILCILALLTLGPLLGCRAARTRLGGSDATARWILRVYYFLAALTAAMVVLILVAPRWVNSVAMLDQAIRTFSVPALTVIPWTGPWIGCLLLARAARDSVHDCAYCDYDLSGNTSGTCSECGRSASQSPDVLEQARARWRRAPWMRTGVIWLGASLLILFFCGVQTMTWGHYCPECGRVEYYRRLQWAMPFTDRAWISGPDHRQPRRVYGLALSQLLDPEATCTHNWMGMGFNIHSPILTTFGQSPDVTTCVIADEVDFPQFIAAHPEAREMMRASMRNRHSACMDVDDLYVAWQAQARSP